MARRGSAAGPPREFVAPGGDWPDGPFLSGTPQEIVYAAHLAARLRELVGEQTVVALAHSVGVTRSALHGILNGSRWPDAVTIARIELGTQQPLWPVRH
jgi:hypothetical protein